MHPIDRDVCGVDVSMTRDETRDMFGIGPFAQEEHDAPALARLHHNLHLKRCAWIQRPAESPGEDRLPHCCRDPAARRRGARARRSRCLNKLGQT